MAEFTVTLKNQTLTFQTNENVFSPRSLDRGTAAMLSVAEFSPDDKVLDLGCGYGAVGILAAKLTAPGQVTMCDISEDALQLARQNAVRNRITVIHADAPFSDAKNTTSNDLAPSFAETLPDSENCPSALRILKSDGFSAIPDRDYTKILSNPPYHTDFSVAKGFIEEGFSHLAVGGKMYMVTKRRDWYKNKLISVFGGVHIDEIDGYYIFTAEKRPRGAQVKTDTKKNLKSPNTKNTPENTNGKRAGKEQKLSKKLARKAMRKHRT